MAMDSGVPMPVRGCHTASKPVLCKYQSGGLFFPLLLISRVLSKRGKDRECLNFYG